MATAIQSINSIEQFGSSNQYRYIDPQVNLNKIKQRITNTIQKSGIQKDIIDANFIAKTFDGKFNSRYSEVLAEELNKAFGETNGVNIPQDLFDPAGTSLQITNFLTKNNNPTEKEMDELISRIQSLTKAAFPEADFKASVFTSSGATFFEELGNFLKSQGGALVEIAPHCESIKNMYPQLISGDSAKAAEAAGKIQGNLVKIIGEGLWERISLQARVKVLKEFSENIETPIGKLFAQSGGKVINITGKQTGGEKIKRGNKEIQQVGDSLVQIEIKGEGDTEIVSFSVLDSTKWTQTNKMEIEPTSWQDKAINITLGQALGQVRRKTYWQKRLGPYLLKEGSHENNRAKKEHLSGIQNWNNTRQAIIMKHAYDTIAVRAGGLPIQTFTLQNKITNILTMLELLAKKFNSDGRVTGGIQNIFSIANYDKYVDEQLEQSSGGTNKDAPELQKTYNSLIQTVMDTQIKISINAFTGF